MDDSGYYSVSSTLCPVLLELSRFRRPQSVRPLAPTELIAASSLVREAGVQGVYVGNFLSRRAKIRDSGEVFGCFAEHGLVGIAYVGDRGNLVLVEREPLDPDVTARVLLRDATPWRIALGPRYVLDRIAEVDVWPPSLLREQIYYGCSEEEVADDAVRGDVRSADRRDLAALVQCALELNRVDLGVDPARVHRAWLRESIRRRIRLRQTLVVGPVGDPWAKLDLGSSGPCGLVVEGVFTRTEHRGIGLARGLVATVAATLGADFPLTCLHVAKDNQAAQRAYHAAGMRVLASSALVLRADHRN